MLAEQTLDTTERYNLRVEFKECEGLCQECETFSVSDGETRLKVNHQSASCSVCTLYFTFITRTESTVCAYLCPLTLFSHFQPLKE